MQDASMRMTAAQFPQAFGKRPIIRVGRAGYNKGRSTEIRSYKTTCQRVLAQSFLLQNRIGTGQSCGINKRSEEHTSELQSRPHLVCRLLLEKKKTDINEQKSSTQIYHLS